MIYIKSWSSISEELHDLHIEHLLRPEKIERKKDMFSDYRNKIKVIYSASVGKVKKHIPSFFYKEKYIIYCKNLQLFL